MSAEPTTNANDPDDANTDIKALREAAKAGKAALSEAEQLKRENAFLRAGVDVDSKIGSMLFKTYDGDLSDIDALRNEWSELQPHTQQQATTPPETAPTPAGFQDPAGQQQHRETISGQGTPTGEAPTETPHPLDRVFEQFHANPSIPLENRQEAAMAEMLGAYFGGDKRVMFNKAAHLGQAQRNASEDVFPG